VTGPLSVDTVLLRRSAAVLRETAQQWRAESADPSRWSGPPPVAASLGDTPLAVEAIALLERRLRSAVSAAGALGQIADHRADLLEQTAAAFEATG
jgi:hypothetical protein